MPNARHATVIQNVKVTQTEVPQALQHLRKRLRDFEQARHTIIHHGAYQDEELYRLELYAELEDSYLRTADNLPSDLAFVPEARVQITRELLSKRTAQYQRFNTCVLGLVSNMLSVLHTRFEEEERRLRLLTGRSPQSGAA